MNEIPDDSLDYARKLKMILELYYGTTKASKPEIQFPNNSFALGMSQ